VSYISVISQSPYSPDLALSDVCVFPTLKMVLKGTRFATMEDIKSKTTAELRNMPREGFNNDRTDGASARVRACA
jgi:hypothetical protein